MIRWLRRVLPRWVTVEQEVDEELQGHLRFRTEELIAKGIDPREASRLAEGEFGDLAAARADLLRIDRSHGAHLKWSALFSDLGGDIRFAGRLLLRSPGFALAALTTLALAIGGNTTAFTLFRAVLIKRLPYANPGRLVQIWEANPQSARRYSEASFPDFFDWRSSSGSFSGLEGYDQTNVMAAGSAGAQMLQGGRVTTGFFDLLGVAPTVGRGFRAEDEVAGGADIALLSFGFWQQRFGGATAVLDSSLIVDGRRYRVVGVLPEEFRFAPVGDASLWFPLDPADPIRQRRSFHGLRVLGRLRDGVTVAEARASLDVVMARLAEAFPESNQGRTARVTPLSEELNGPSRPLLIALLAAMTLVLAIACANIAALMLARALAREEEMTVRSSLGASKVRLLRQLMVESLLLAGIGGVLGVGLARASLPFLGAILPGGLRAQLPVELTSTMDGTILGYSCLITLLTGIGFGVGPLLHVVRTQRSATIGRRATDSRAMLRLRDGLIVTQIALTATLLVGSALLARSIVALLQVDLGFQVQQVTSLRVALSGPRFSSSETQQQFFERLLETVRAIPGVTSVGAASRLPLDGGGSLTFRVEGEPELPPAERQEVVGRSVAGDYFQTLQVPLQSGRFLAAVDNGSSPNRVVVDASTARELFPAGEAVGRVIRFYAFPAITWEVVGIVSDIRTGPLDQPFRPTIYTSHLQDAQNRMSLVVRSGVEPAALTRLIRKAVLELDRDAAVYSERTLKEQVAESAPVQLRRLSLTLLGLCAALALVLSMVGLYGVVAFTVARRERELGIRAALGAGPSALQHLVIRQGLRLALAGGLLGLALSLLLAGSIRALLFGISATDPVAYAGTALLLAGVTAVASWIPARRATRCDPAMALRRG